MSDDNSTGASILVVEDDEQIAELMRDFLEADIRGAPAAGSPDGGGGLGLTIAKRLLEHQHATLTAHNQPTGGAVISLTLQRAPSANPSADLVG